MNFWLAQLKHNGAWVTVGTLAAGVWRRIHNAFLRRALPGRPVVNIHPSAFLRGLSHLQIGDGFRANRGLWLEAVTSDGEHSYDPRISIGRNVIINENVHIGATCNVVIGNDVLMGSRIFISDHNHGFYDGPEHSNPDVAPRLRRLTATKRVIIGDNVWLGDMVIVLPGVTIGAGSVIGGNSVVTRDVPAESIAVGNPARVVKRFDRSSGQWLRI